MNLTRKLLFALPIIDAVLNQVGNVFPVEVGSFSLFQIERLVVLSIAVLWLLNNPTIIFKSRNKHLLLWMTLSLAMTWLFAAGGVKDIIAYGQIFYWLILWTIVDSLATDESFRVQMEMGLIIASLIILASIYIGYFSGLGLNFYEKSNIVSSSGWFNTSKTISVTASLGTLLYAHRHMKENPGANISLFLFTAYGVYLTQARAGILAFLCMALWFCWEFFMKSGIWHSFRFRIVLIFFVYIIIIAFVLFDIESLFQFGRWSELLEENGGSGRKLLWPLAFQYFQIGSWAQKLFGYGYGGLLNANAYWFGDPIHTHNDFLDALTIGGLLMAITLLLLYVMLYQETLRAIAGRKKMAFGMGFLVLFVVNGNLTGMLFAASDMFALLAAWSCITREPIIQHKQSKSQKMNVVAPWKKD